MARGSGPRTKPASLGTQKRLTGALRNQLGQAVAAAIGEALLPPASRQVGRGRLTGEGSLGCTPPAQGAGLHIGLAPRHKPSAFQLCPTHTSNQNQPTCASPGSPSRWPPPAPRPRKTAGGGGRRRGLGTASRGSSIGGRGRVQQGQAGRGRPRQDKAPKCLRAVLPPTLQTSHRPSTPPRWSPRTCKAPTLKEPAPPLGSHLCLVVHAGVHEGHVQPEVVALLRSLRWRKQQGMRSGEDAAQRWARGGAQAPAVWAALGSSRTTTGLVEMLPKNNN